MITPQTAVVNQTAPDMTLDQFASVLTGKSPLTPDDILKSYQAVIAQKVSPAFLLAVFWVESKFGRLGICRDYNTKSPGNTRTSVRYTAPQIQVVSTPQGNYVRYSSWDKGFTDLAARLVEPDYVYARRGLVTVEQLLPVFAPPTDNNDPASYVQSVVNQMNSWIGGGSSNTMEIIDLSNNTPSSVYSDRMGFSVSELILHDTAGSSDNNNASQAACQNALNATIRWFQGPGGVSIHYLIGPENLGGKIYRLCKESVAAYHAVGNKGSVGGVSKDNLISIGIERFGQPNEAVGPNQRNAMLWLASDICSRYGLSANQVISHMSIQSDRRDGGVLLEAVRQVVINGGLSYMTTSNQRPVIPAPDTVVINGKVIGHGFLDFYNKLAGVSPNFQLLVLGLPVTNEFDCPVNGDGKNYTVQLFERGCLLFEQANASPWDTHLATTAQLENALAAAKARALI